ncbi:putative proteasome subunit alpha type 6 protein [Rosellinia necatrix]|uniref:Putative proteasome subunit alpha type 6 protein n=1 Tax=Rosellinia necatrix TaxID=77044 RepID=A0A1W2TCX7_ROSNE|nr:putative proteasome subunit alpha type 6 protein [Rosellinia necatrix]
MSSFAHSTGDMPTQRVPAWKRLGLKLKPASEGQSHDATTHRPTTTTTTTTTGAPSTVSSVPNNRAQSGSFTTTPNAKRRASGGAPALDHSAKRPRQDHHWQGQQQTLPHQTPKKAKSVSFTADTAVAEKPRASAPLAKKTKQQKQAPATAAAAAAVASPRKPAAPVNLEPALAYLRTWHTARSAWKFNKNHQTRLLEQVFAGADETTIPAVDIGVFYQYIRGLQGGVRTRLRQLADGIRADDMEKGAAGFAAVAGRAEMAERKQKEYEEVIRSFLSQQAAAAATATRTSEKRRFDEVEYVLRTTDMEMQRRVVKRMRAETVRDELSETDASETTTTTTTTTTTATQTGDNPDATRLSLNDGPQQRTKRKRKVRTAVVEDETSSESESEPESDSDSDTSSSGSSTSSGSDSDVEGAVVAAAAAVAGSRVADGGDTSSSSSSSSSSESGSDSEGDDED